MDKQAPKHPNGDCEACGGPCAVYGPRYCPECYWPNTYPDRVNNAGFSNISATSPRKLNKYAV